ncbi:MAG TPA: geranylgeranyl reductase family protein [bacterium]|nr:geranylgeranyl reductase family protein [bacterium]
MSDAAPAGHEVIVVGAGPAGSAAAYALASCGVRALLLDKAVFPREKVCGDGLTPRAVAALDELNLLDRLLPLGHAVGEVVVTAPNGARVAASVPGGAGARRPAMLVVPRLRLDDAVRSRAVEAGASFEGGVDVEDIRRENGRVAVRAVRAGRLATFSARLAIVATGASLVLPKRLGVLRRPPVMMRAARTYLPAASAEDAARIEIRFAGVPLPGYGWIFPVSRSAVNMGVGFYARGRGPASSAREVCRRFVGTIEGGSGGGSCPIRSYPLRVDFPSSPAYADGVLFAGEAAGLVNPLTGEGIDYALESGRIAADHAAVFLAGRDGSPGGFAAAASAYERALRSRFERLFAVCRILRDTAARPALLNRLVGVAGRRDDLTMALVNLVLGNREPLAAGSVRAKLGRLLLAR